MATPKFNNTLPILVWLVVLVWLTVSKLNLTTLYFLGPMMLALGWFLLIPLLHEVGVDAKAVVWFQKAGLFALLGVAFGMLEYVTFLQSMSSVIVLFDHIGILLSWLFASIGIFIGFFKWK